MNDIFVFGASFALYYAPLVFLYFVIRRNPRIWWITLLIFFLATFIGDITYLLTSREHNFNEVTTLKFWNTVIAWYPFAVLPLGFWAIFLGALGTNLLESIGIRFRLDTFRLSFTGCLLGAFVGTVFNLTFRRISIFVQGNSVQSPIDDLSQFLLAGLIAGGVCGFVSGYLALNSYHK